MVGKALDKANNAARTWVDNVKEGQSDDAPVDLPGTFMKRDSDTDEVVEEIPGDTSRGGGIPNRRWPIR